MKQSLKHIYLLALAQGLTAKEAAYKYNVNYRSLMTRGSEHKLPPLMSHWSWDDQRALEKMSTNELLLLKEKYNDWILKIDHAIAKQNEEQQTKE